METNTSQQLTVAALNCGYITFTFVLKLLMWGLIQFKYRNLITCGIAAWAYQLPMMPLWTLL